ncbi:MAG: PH domain-containing protein [Rhodomicrobiaceae bacterium]
MGYIEQSLGQDETLIRKAHFHWFHRGQGYISLLAFMAGAGYLFTQYQLLWLPVVIGALGFVVFLRIMVPIWTTEIGVTSERLIIKRGLFTRYTDELELWAIEEVSLEQGILGRALGFGGISAQGTGDDSLQIPAIAEPLLFRKAIQTAISKERAIAGDAGRLRGRTRLDRQQSSL